jgi:hypothetical protein
MGQGGGRNLYKLVLRVRAAVTRRVRFGGGDEDLQSSYSEGADGTLEVTLPPLEGLALLRLASRPRLAEA